MTLTLQMFMLLDQLVCSSVVNFIVCLPVRIQTCKFYFPSDMWDGIMSTFASVANIFFQMQITVMLCHKRFVCLNDFVDSLVLAFSQHAVS